MDPMTDHLTSSPPTPSAIARPLAALVLATTICAALLSPSVSTASTPKTSSPTTLAGLAGSSPASILAQGCANTLAARSMVATTSYKTPAAAGGVRSMQWTLTVGSSKGIVHYTDKASVSAVIMPVISYLKGDQRYWTTDANPPRPTQTASLANHWLSVASSSANNSVMAALLGQSSLQGLLANCVAGPATVTKKKPSKLGTVAVIPVVVSSATMRQTFWITAQGSALIIKSTETGGLSGSRTTILGGFNKQKPPAPPLGAVPLDPLLAT